MKKKKQKCKCGSTQFRINIESMPNSSDNVVKILICKKCGKKKALEVEHIG